MKWQFILIAVLAMSVSAEAGPITSLSASDAATAAPLLIELSFQNGVPFPGAPTGRGDNTFGPLEGEYRFSVIRNDNNVSISAISMLLPTVTGVNGLTFADVSAQLGGKFWNVVSPSGSPSKTYYTIANAGENLQNVGDFVLTDVNLKGVNTLGTVVNGNFAFNSLGTTFGLSVDGNNLSTIANFSMTGSNLFISGNTAAVPEPSTLLLCGVGLAGVYARRLRKKKNETPVETLAM